VDGDSVTVGELTAAWHAFRISISHLILKTASSQWRDDRIILWVWNLGRRIMHLIPEIRVPFANVGTRVAKTGSSFAVTVAYLLFLLMFLTMIAEIFLVLMRALA
jgi:hypothetical protein